MPELQFPEGVKHPGPGQPETFPPGPWDPGLFRDDDGRWYLYWGSSNVFPLYGIELDMREVDSQRIAYIGRPRPLISLQPQQHGWERFGPDHAGENQPSYMEGAWMTKHGGRYYLQYGAPGTEYNVYATGTYVSDHPLGPFEYAPYNPVGYKPGGFVHGAGHGNTFQDAHGNWWNTGTPWVGHNWTFERRVALFPAAFSEDGQMSVDTRFGDFPHYMPTAKVADPQSLFTGWMLLSYRKPATASSTLGPPAAVPFIAANATDENPRTFWVAAKNEAGQTLEAPVKARYVRYVHGHVGAKHLAISDLRVFGDAGGPGPAAPRDVTAKRIEPRTMTVSWRPVPGAVGYNVRWGIEPDRLTLTYQVFADREATLDIRALSAGVGYHVAVEAFNENGVSKLSRVVSVRQAITSR
ncbi:MAG: coagulation factor 5/8 type domain protein [Steroidobacteraceae bacterium]|nr:coagulation factor 5/8 type domain protein [Steroidobacteraceae bacterium]